MAYPARENHEIMCQWNSLSILLALKLPLRLAGVKLSLNQVWESKDDLLKDKMRIRLQP